MFTPVALFGIAIVSCVTSVAILGSLVRAGVAGLRRWISAYGLFGVAFVLLAWPALVPLPVLVVAVNTLLMAGSFLLLQGTRQFFGRPPAYRAEWMLFCVWVGALGYWTLVSPNMPLRIVLSSSCFVYVRLVLGWIVVRFRPPHRPRYSYLFVSICAFAGVGVHLARGVIYGSGWERQVTFFDSTPLNVTLLGLSILSLPCLSIGIAMLAHDRLAQRMERLATIDELTGALVRRAFIEKAAALVERARTQASAVSIAIIDLDHFKGVNDRYGHAAGDRVLACFASVVAVAIGSADVFGRLGGEEFAIVFASKGKAEAECFTNELRARLATSPHNEAACTFSAGVESLGAGDTLAGAMARADAALYAAKAMGRNCVVSAPCADTFGDRLMTEL